MFGCPSNTVLAVPIDQFIYTLLLVLITVCAAVSGSGSQLFDPTPLLDANQCLDTSSRSAWNRTFNVNRHSLQLTLAVTVDSPAHWIVNYIFAILARERLGYRELRFSSSSSSPADSVSPDSVLAQLSCAFDSCLTSLPQAHINLNVWLPIGLDPSRYVGSRRSSGKSSSSTSRQESVGGDQVTYYGLLGPVSQAGLVVSDSHFHKLVRLSSQQSNNGSVDNNHCLVTSDNSTGSNCSAPVCSTVYQLNVTRFDGAPAPANNTESGSHDLLFMSPSSSNYPSRDHPKDSRACIIAVSNPLSRLYSSSASCPSSSSTYYYNYTSHRSVKLAWSLLASHVPLLHQLVERMRIANVDYARFVLSSTTSLTDYQQHRSHAHQLSYWKSACQWIKANHRRWPRWTSGWNRKQSLTLAGLYSLYGKWSTHNLVKVTQDTVDFVNKADAYLGSTEYRIDLVVRNLSSSRDVVLNDYFNLLHTPAINDKLIGLLVALSSDAVEPVIKFAGNRHQIVVSSTSESIRDDDHQPHPPSYFFRTIPSMWTWRALLIKLFHAWNIRRIALFRKDSNFIKPRPFIEARIKISFEFHQSEEFITPEQVTITLNELANTNSRIFVIEYFARTTGLILCQAYHRGFLFEAGYLYFLNPWLQNNSNWWLHPNVLGNTNCSASQLTVMVNNSFTLDHGLIEQSHNGQPILIDSRPIGGGDQSVDCHSRPRRLPVTNWPDSIGARRHYAADSPPRTSSFRIYTLEAVLALASALTQLIKQHDQSLLLQRDQQFELLERALNRTDLTYRLAQADSSSSSCTRLRFTSNNTGRPDYWVVSQRQGDYIQPVIVWYSPITSSTEEEDVVSEDRLFSHLANRTVGKAYWGINRDGPPWDGSPLEDKCSVKGLGQLLGVNCPSTYIIIFIVLFVILFATLSVIGIIYCRRRVREAERRIRQPYEELCQELEPLDVKAADIVLNRRIGQGAFGLVYGGEAKLNARWEAVAVKVIADKATFDSKRDFLMEAKLMRSFHHDHIVQLLGVCLARSDNDLYLIMEFMLLGDLRSYLMSRRVLAQQTPNHDDIRPSRLTKMALDIAEGLFYLHGQAYAHRDIACRNCLVGSDYVVKLGDFGLTREMTGGDTASYYRFTRNCELPVRWMSPEAIQFAVASVQSEIWSYGVVLYEIITFGVFPYEGLNDVEVVELVKRMDFRFIDLLPPVTVNTTVASLIDMCCQHRWQQRPASMKHIIDFLSVNSECIRPFLTDEPPKPNSSLDVLDFQPGACMIFGGGVGNVQQQPPNNSPGGALIGNSPHGGPHSSSTLSFVAGQVGDDGGGFFGTSINLSSFGSGGLASSRRAAKPVTNSTSRVHCCYPPPVTDSKQPRLQPLSNHSRRRHFTGGDDGYDDEDSSRRPLLPVSRFQSPGTRLDSKSQSTSQLLASHSTTKSPPPKALPARSVDDNKAGSNMVFPSATSAPCQYQQATSSVEQQPVIADNPLTSSSNLIGHGQSGTVLSETTTTPPTTSHSPCPLLPPPIVAIASHDKTAGNDTFNDGRAFIV